MLPLILRWPSASVNVFGRLRHHRVAVVVEPIHERADRGVLLILSQRRIVERPHELAFGSEESEEALVIDVEPERLGRRVKVGAIDEDRQALIRIKMHGRNPFMCYIQRR